MLLFPNQYKKNPKLAELVSWIANRMLENRSLQSAVSVSNQQSDGGLRCHNVPARNVEKLEILWFQWWSVRPLNTCDFSSFILFSLPISENDDERYFKQWLDVRSCSNFFFVSCVHLAFTIGDTAPNNYRWYCAVSSVSVTFLENMLKHRPNELKVSIEHV